MYYKGEDVFGPNVELGVLGARAVAAHLTAYRHEMRPLDRLTFSKQMAREFSGKGICTPDLECARCGIRVEARYKSMHQISVSDSEARPFDRELGPRSWIAFVTPAGILYVRVKVLAAMRAIAEKRRNRHNDPYLIWPLSAVRTEYPPTCR